MTTKEMLENLEFINLIPIISERLEIPAMILWKDLLVFLVLKEFTVPGSGLPNDICERMVFKGGTSLSKCYRLIKRFSEDVDLAFVNDKSVIAYLGQGKRLAYLKAIESFVKGLDFITDMDPIDKTEGKRITLFNFKTPDTFAPQSYEGYVKTGVQLEMDFRADPVPHSKKPVGSIIGDFLKENAMDAFKKFLPLAEFEIKVMDLTRTLVEKTLAITSCLTQYTTKGEKKQKLKLEEKARHFYDVAMLWEHLQDKKDMTGASVLQGLEIKRLFIRSIERDIAYKSKNYLTSNVSGLPHFGNICKTLAQADFNTEYSEIFEKSPLYFPQEKPTSQNVIDGVSQYFAFLEDCFDGEYV